MITLNTRINYKCKVVYHQNEFGSNYNLIPTSKIRYYKRNIIENLLLSVIYRFCFRWLWRQTFVSGLIYNYTTVTLLEIIFVSCKLLYQRPTNNQEFVWCANNYDLGLKRLLELSGITLHLQHVSRLLFVLTAVLCLCNTNMALYLY